MGMSFWGTGYWHTVLPRRSQAVPSRKRDERSGGLAADHDVSAPRGRTRYQLRIRAIQNTGVEGAIWPLSAPLPRPISSRAVFAKLCPAYGRLVCTEASGRGLRRDLCGMDHPTLALA